MHTDPQGQLDTWITRAKAGHPDALGDIIARYEARLSAYVRPRVGAYLRGRIGVEDLVQETFLRMLEIMDGFQWRDEAAFWAWLTGVSRNVIQRAVRRERAKRRDRAREVDLDEEGLAVPGVSAVRVLQRNERLERLKRALDSLSPEHRRAVFLAHIQRLPTREIARRLGKSPNATSMLLLRAYKRLRALLGETESLGLEHDRGLEGSDDDEAT